MNEKRYIVVDNKILNQLACLVWNMPYADEDGRIKWFKLYVKITAGTYYICDDCSFYGYEECCQDISWIFCPYIGKRFENDENETNNICDDCPGDDCPGGSHWTFCPRNGKKIETEEIYFYEAETLDEVLDKYAIERGWTKKELENEKDELLEKATVIVKVREDLLQKFKEIQRQTTTKED